MTPEQFAAQVQTTLDTHCHAVVLYGSIIREDIDAKHSDANLLVVLDAVAPSLLATINPLVRRWMRRGNPPPLFFDAEHIRSSADAFPIEFLDLKTYHRVLIGQDPFAEIVVHPTHLRLQCENELKGRFLQLATAVAVTAHRPKALRAILLSASSSCFALFRGVLRLANTAPHPHRRGVIEQLKACIDANLRIFEEVLDVREGKSSWRGTEVIPKTEQFLTALRAVIRFVDTLPLAKGGV
ncbi:MAG: hypothetical protein HY543_11150 [Deltaproteobacteria bacterium]|nr:hypothetical protein [Deltaproteobacteria bacterium]